MTLRLNKEQLSTSPEGLRRFFEKSTLVGDFVDHKKRQEEVRLSVKILDSQTIWLNEPQINSVQEASAQSAATQGVKHLGLNVQRKDAPLRTDHARELKGEETNGWSWLDNLHSFRHVRTQDGPRRVLQPPDQVEDRDKADQRRADEFSLRA